MATPDMSRHVPKKLRQHFVQAFEGTYGWWFEFDGSVSFQDLSGGGLPFAYGKTVEECRKMMKRGITAKGAKDNG